MRRSRGSPRAIVRVRIAGVFAVFATGHEEPERAWAGAVAMEAGGVLATAGVRARVEVPYMPGHLALQRGPLLEAAVKEVGPTPDILLVNATGRDHPRRAGLALHLGAVLDLITVGVTDHPLVATTHEPGPEEGATAPSRSTVRSLGWSCAPGGTSGRWSCILGGEPIPRPPA